MAQNRHNLRACRPQRPLPVSPQRDREKRDQQIQVERQVREIDAGVEADSGNQPMIVPMNC